jgi:hypothetical protein
VDVGEKPAYLVFDDAGKPIGTLPNTLSIPIPFIYDLPPNSVVSKSIFDVFSKAASETQTHFLVPISKIFEFRMKLGDHIVPLVNVDEIDKLLNLDCTPKLVEIDLDESTNDQELHTLILKLRNAIPDALLIYRMTYSNPERYLRYMECGVRIFHLVSNYHGCGHDGRFVLDLIREAHLAFVGSGSREEVTLIGSGGIVASEHVPKAIIAGLDLVALDTPLLVALQALFHGECVGRDDSIFILPESLNLEWGVQRLKNLTAAWRDQLLEILGAMGIREVRRLRGEIGRAMFQVDLEREAFAEIDGYER